MTTVETLGRYLDPLSLLIVFGGAFASAVFRSTFADVRCAVRALLVLVRADPSRDAALARTDVIRMERMVETRSRAVVDRLPQSNAFVARAARTLAEASDAAAFQRWAEEEAHAIERRHAAAQGVWRAVAEAAPAMGMLGTVVGLTGMFSALDDSAAIGPAMAVAMRTTFLGLVLSAGIAGPITARLERLSAAEREWRDWVARRLARIAETEFAPATRGNTRLRLVE